MLEKESMEPQVETFAQLVKFFILLIAKLSPKKWLLKANTLIILDI